MSVKTFRCLSWVAVSTKQQNKEDSPEAQSKGNIQFAQQLGDYYPNCKGEVIDEIRLAGTRSIPSLEKACVRYPDQYGKLVRMIENREIDIVICRERERIGRKLGLTSQFADLCDTNDVIILARNSSLPPSLDIAKIKADESRGIVAAVEGALAESYIKRFTARSRDGREARVREKKLFSNRVPYGYQYVYDKDLNVIGIETVEKEAKVLSTFFELYLNGHGEYYCAKFFNAHGIESPAGGKWYRSAFTPFLKRIMIYAGYIDMYRDPDAKGDHFLVKGVHPPIISEETAMQVNRVRKSRSYTRAIPHTAFAGVCICVSCGKSMLAFTWKYKKANKVDESVYKGYTCKNEECPLQAQIRDYVVREYIRSAVEILSSQAHIDLPDGLLDAEKRRQEIQSELDALRIRTKELEENKDTLLDLLLEKRIKKDNYNQRVDDIEQQIERLTLEIDTKSDNLNQIDDKASIYDRLDEIRQSGLLYLAREKEDPEAVSMWMKAHFRIYVKPGRGDNRVRIDYI